MEGHLMMFLSLEKSQAGLSGWPEKFKLSPACSERGLPCPLATDPSRMAAPEGLPFGVFSSGEGMCVGVTTVSPSAILRRA